MSKIETLRDLTSAESESTVEAGEDSSRNLDEIKRLIALLQSATSRGGWWDGLRGKAAIKAFQGWGATERERRLTGDPTAEPKSVGGGGSGSRSKGSMSSIILTHSMVHDWLRSRTSEEVDLLSWIYIMGTEDKPLVVAYVLANGSISDPVEANAPVPPAFLAYQRKVTLSEARIQMCEVVNYPDRFGIRNGLEQWGIPWGIFVESQHLRLGQKIVHDLGL